MYYARPSEIKKVGNENNNCGPIAMSIAFDVDYSYAAEFATKNWNFGIKGSGSTNYKIKESFTAGFPIFGKMACKVNATQVYKQGDGTMLPRRMKIGTFMGKYPTGTYFILVAKHALAIVEGKLVDNFISLDRRIEDAWEILPADLPATQFEFPTIPADISKEADLVAELAEIVTDELPTILEVNFEETPSQEVIEVPTSVEVILEETAE